MVECGSDGEPECGVWKLWSTGVRVVGVMENWGAGVWERWSTGVLVCGCDRKLGCWGMDVIENWGKLAIINKPRMLDNHTLEIRTKTLAVGFSPRWITS